MTPASPGWDEQYRLLAKGEIIQEGDEYDACRDGWRDTPIWKPVETLIGHPAPDPQYPAHTLYRRLVSRRGPWIESSAMR